MNVKSVLHIVEFANSLGNSSSSPNHSLMSDGPLLTLDLPGIPKIKSGKVREIFDLGEFFLFVATDRISAFDCILPNGIPRKGEVLTQISHFWFNRLSRVVPNHRVSPEMETRIFTSKHLPASVHRRSMVVKKAKPLPIECVVRGYLAGSGWKEYKQSGTVCGIKIPPGLKESSELPEPIFTPATKAETGHDINIDFAEASRVAGADTAARARELSLAIYKEAAAYAKDRGIIIADTKFEFGYFENELLLIDEVLTPDSSRFWPADSYAPGKSQASFDKQFVRDYLESIPWNKQPPAPPLPDSVIDGTRQKYLEAYTRLTGMDL